VRLRVLDPIENSHRRNARVRAFAEIDRAQLEGFRGDINNITRKRYTRVIMHPLIKHKAVPVKFALQRHAIKTRSEVN